MAEVDRTARRWLLACLSAGFVVAPLAARPLAPKMIEIIESELPNPWILSALATVFGAAAAAYVLIRWTLVRSRGWLNGTWWTELIAMAGAAAATLLYAWGLGTALGIRLD